ncbi:MAG TPA: hypothetical protein VFN05_00875 [Actinomycetes bacterium]|nr:hypothetical protein [Actinomycetes bacterium]
MTVALPPAEESFEGLIGTLEDDVYPPGHLEELRGDEEWDEG